MFIQYGVDKRQWRASEKAIKKAEANFEEILKADSHAPDGYRAPKPGEIFKNPFLANTFRLLAKDGKEGFYKGPVAKALVDIVQEKGGHITMEDLENHAKTGSEPTESICLRFNGQNVGSDKGEDSDGKPVQTAHEHGVDVWEHPPNGQGIVALMALGILEELEKTGKIPTFTERDHNCTEYLHAITEALRIAFADGTWFVTDPNVVKVPTADLISRPYLAERAKLFNPKHPAENVVHGSPAHQRSDTVYFATADRDGNACSFINSIFGGFGNGIVPKGCGFTLQNRGASFSLDPKHPNVFAPSKRPYHTIIPAMITNPDDDSLHSVFGVMGRYMQPQGHVQVLMNMLVFKHNPQTALDAPRIFMGGDMPDQGQLVDAVQSDSLDAVYLEEGISENVAKELKAMGHKVRFVKGYDRALFGRGQIIRCHMEDGRQVYSAGSDPRGDGGAFPV